MQKIFAFIISAIFLIIFSSIVSAIPLIPSDFWGTATINGYPAPDGLGVRAFINGVNYPNDGFTWGGFYFIDVIGDDPDTPEKEGGIEGDNIVFIVDGHEAAETGVWHSGLSTVLDLTIIYVPDCIDDDMDGYGYPASLLCTYPESDCDDSNPNVNPGEIEICNGIDDNCVNGVDEGGDALCSNEVFCDGTETCNGLAGCQQGTAVDCSDSMFCTVNERCDESIDGCASDPRDCSANNMAPIETCFNSPDDGNIFTWDFRSEFISACNEPTGSCTTGDPAITHSCDIAQCSAECEINDDCPPTECDNLDGCVGNDYYDYTDIPNNCLSGCSCEQNACGALIISYDDPRCTECQTDDECNNWDNDYCNGDMIIHDEGRCVSYACQAETTTVEDCNDMNNNYCDGTEIKNDDYTCGAASCVLDQTIVVDDCNNGIYCDGQETCQSAACTAGIEVDCSGLDDQCNIGVCNEDIDNCEKQTANEGLSCNDGLFCNMGETCYSGICTGGSGRDCSDSISCTLDSCNEADGRCDNSPQDSVCNDGLFCNGQEYCGAVNGCQAGTAVDCSDSMFCTVNEMCDENADSCISESRDCSANNVAPIETCFNSPDSNPLTFDYFAGFVSSCDDGIDSCTAGSIGLTHTCDSARCNAECENDDSCDDNNPLTADSCDECLCENELQGECMSDEDCGTDYFLDEIYCSKDSIYDYYVSYSCQNPATTSANCVSSTNPKLKEKCRYGCSDGKCKEKPITNKDLYVGDLRLDFDGELQLSMSFENKGEQDLDDLKISVLVYDLGLYYAFGDFDIKEGEKATKTKTIELPFIEKGVYDARIVISNDKIRRVIHRELVIE